MAKKIIVNLTRPVFSVYGKAIEGTDLATLLAEQISVSASERNIIKLWGWAVDLAKGLPLVLDNEDFDSLKEFVTLLKTLPVVTKANILTVMQEAKDAAERPQRSAAAVAAVEEAEKAAEKVCQS